MLPDGCLVYSVRKDVRSKLEALSLVISKSRQLYENAPDMKDAAVVTKRANLMKKID